MQNAQKIVHSALVFVHSGIVVLLNMLKIGELRGGMVIA
jgi:hypothetical protein